jgi:hypothetical protein
MDSLVVPEMRLRVRGGGLEKKDLAMLDVLATADWERPLYVNNTSLAQFNVDLSRYVVQEGNAYRILPVYNPRPFNQLELVNTSVSYENMMTKFQFRNVDNPKVYFNQALRRRVRFKSAAPAPSLATESIMATTKQESAGGFKPKLLELITSY